MLQRHIGKERLEIATRLRDSGLGNGAIVEAYDWYTSSFAPCIITDFNESATTYHNNVFDSRKIKLSKRVRVTLYSYSGGWGEYTKDYSHGNHVKESITVLARPLHDTSRTIVASVKLSDLPAFNRNASGKIYSWERWSNILSHSTDGDVDMNMLSTQFILNERLCRKGDILRSPIFP
jgi:hypothetical protein